MKYNSQNRKIKLAQKNKKKEDWDGEG